MPAKSEPESPIALKVKATWASISAAARLQTIFDETFKVQTEPVKHDKTAVLLLHWDEKVSDMDVSAELNDLQTVFEKDYRFEVIRKKIVAKDHPRPEKQLRKFLTEFIHDFDSPHTLYIIYYAGHGWAGDVAGHLNIASSTSQEAQTRFEINSVVWNNAEQCLRETQSDILVVFDCCDAGALHGRYRGQYPFEFLGACEKGEEAPWPGDRSFTSAMIWALRELGKDKAGFDSRTLKSKILQYKGFPHDKIHPVLFHRFQNGGAHVWIEPVVSSGDFSGNTARAKHYREETADAITEWVDLRLYFNRTPSTEDFANLAKILNKHARKSGLRRVSVQDRSLDPHLVSKHASLWADKALPSRLSPTSPHGNLEKRITHSTVLVETPLESQEALMPLTDSAIQFPSPLSGPDEMRSKDVQETPHIRRHSMSTSETRQNRTASGHFSQILTPPRSRPS